MKSIMLALMLASVLFGHAQVGIGTNTPSTNSMLDVNSTNKGIMLPRLSDTTAVSNPGAGLMIYNMHMNAPAFHNGTSWRTVAAESSAAPADSLAYTITNPFTGFTAGTFPLLAVSHAFSNSGAIGGAGATTYQSIGFSKLPDINSIGFEKALASGNTMNMIVEFRFYVPGAANPYYSIKATIVKMSSFQASGSGSGNVVENYTMIFQTVGYKDWVNNSSFAWNLSTNVSVPY